MANTSKITLVVLRSLLYENYNQFFIQSCPKIFNSELGRSNPPKAPFLTPRGAEEYLCGFDASRTVPSTY